DTPARFNPPALWNAYPSVVFSQPLDARRILSAFHLRADLDGGLANDGFVPLPDQRTAQMAGEALCLSPPEITRIDANSFSVARLRETARLAKAFTILTGGSVGHRIFSKYVVCVIRKKPHEVHHRCREWKLGDQDRNHRRLTLGKRSGSMDYPSEFIPA